ncbi:MAG: alpha-amylase family glycosyl hydrolase, partial [Lachnospiraceae bacterium]|nr:alpha-amylase family glycosyl hydrolase [Lachnospiraceae bacterium]
HGDYNRWVNEGTLHSVTNYHLHKALYSGHNDHNYFEIAHTVKRLYDMGGGHSDGLKLYNFVDNHDVERIYTKLTEKAHVTPVHILLYTLPGVPSVYYGSEFGIEGKKERYSDDSLTDYADAIEKNPLTKLIAALGKIRQTTPALSYGDYRELLLRNRQYAFSRNYEGTSVLVTVNNDTSDFVMTLPAGSVSEYVGALSGERVSVNGGNLVVNIRANSGDIWIPVTDEASLPEGIGKLAEAVIQNEPIQKEEKTTVEEVREQKVEKTEEAEPAKPTKQPEEKDASDPEHSRQYEEGRIAGLQEAILAIMEKNGPVTDQMRRDVRENVYHDSLIAWIKSFR